MVHFEWLDQKKKKKKKKLEHYNQNNHCSVIYDLFTLLLFICYRNQILSTISFTCISINSLSDKFKLTKLIFIC